MQPSSKNGCLPSGGRMGHHFTLGAEQGTVMKASRCLVESDSVQGPTPERRKGLELLSRQQEVQQSAAASTTEPSAE